LSFDEGKLRLVKFEDDMTHVIFGVLARYASVATHNGSGRIVLRVLIPILHQSELMMYGKDVMERTSPGLRSM